ncbi:hypothetical protein N7462_003014 [Penicillium macrosclerotiorum]|uniref:uncharacterized protein n=1 Tax=Penicillium macrosclerotiorum TaxID=303699 RepID=UPI0025484CDA|nr:uncharacterized protein N7462_003014 [Penicillium macrosclerotiorum]KAJ5688622.1 hypothetical protein N7462_003014 [Penicillium macrosclerotiorum]
MTPHLRSKLDSNNSRGSSSIEDTADHLLAALKDGQLTVKSKLYEFCNAFDLKDTYWKAFYDELAEKVCSSSSWTGMKDVKKRSLVAESFIEQVGPKYWGLANRKKYLQEKYLQEGTVSTYPRHRKS